MKTQKLRKIIVKKLPTLMQNDETFRQVILEISSTQFADKVETKSRFDRMMEMFQQQLDEEVKNRKSWEAKWKIQAEERRKDQEAQNVKWKAQTEERRKEQEAQNVKWEAQAEERRKDQEAQEARWKTQAEERKKDQEVQEAKWEKNQQVITDMMAEIKELNRKHDSTIGALGSRWGLHSEASFRNALKGILTDIPNIEVLNVNEYDEDGFVFGHPEQVELDVIIKNGLLIICEIKSSTGKGEMYIFERKVRFYEKLHNRKADRMMVISPMIDDKAKIVAKNLGIETYSYANNVDL
ncbi:DUF3782 domain-containing protein [Thiotrichales bacterium HSG1]|nr:DUF3782 domain-containing protein [Thiotrichales bacterium HSG1]